jgi:REDY-like protein HapK
MTTVVVLFNLKAGVNAADYEKFARDLDIPGVNKLPSVKSFEVLRCEGLMGGGSSPYQYVELLRVHDLAGLGKDVQTPSMQKVVSAFREMADNPLFILTTDLSA